MFTKEIITEIFTKRNGQNFIINTNEGVGKGINGVSFSSYAGSRTTKNRDYPHNMMNETAKIIEIGESYLVITYKNESAYFTEEMDIVIPYDTITSIKFIKEEGHGYPTKIVKNKLFK